jgi:hypothetical protein
MQFIVVRGLATEPCMPPLFFQIPLLDHAMLTHQWKRLSAYWCEHSNVFTTRGIISSLRCQLWCDTNFAWVTIIMTTPWEETTCETSSARFDLYTSKTERYTLYPWEHQQDLLCIQSSDFLGANLCYFVKLFYWRKIVFQSTMCVFSKYKRHSIFQFLQPSLWSTTPILFIKAFCLATSSQFICTFVRWQTVV